MDIISTVARFKNIMTGDINIEIIYVREIYYSLAVCGASHINFEGDGKL
jgi:hypothetical protein